MNATTMALKGFLESSLTDQEISALAERVVASILKEIKPLTEKEKEIVADEGAFKARNKSRHNKHWHPLSSYIYLRNRCWHLEKHFTVMGLENQIRLLGNDLVDVFDGLHKRIQEDEERQFYFTFQEIDLETVSVDGSDKVRLDKLAAQTDISTSEKQAIFSAMGGLIAHAVESGYDYFAKQLCEKFVEAVQSRLPDMKDLTSAATFCSNAITYEFIDRTHDLARLAWELSIEEGCSLDMDHYRRSDDGTNHMRLFNRFSQVHGYFYHITEKKTDRQDN